MQDIINKYKNQLNEAFIQLKTSGERRKQIPNILTASRLFAPFVIIPSVATGNFLAAGISTLLFSATDMVDGFLARKMKTTSELGKDLDAVSDKVFIGTLLASIVIINPIYMVPLALEGTIGGINTYKKLKNKNPESHMVGKVKMNFLYPLVALGFVDMYISVPTLLTGLLYASTIGLQVATIYDYTKNNEKVVEENSIVINEDIAEEENVTKKPVKEKTNVQKRLDKYRRLQQLLEEQRQIQSYSNQEEIESLEGDINAPQLKIQNSNKK